MFENEELYDYAESEDNFRDMYKELVKRNIKRYRRLLKTGKTVFAMGERGEISDLFYQNGIPVFESFEQIAKVYSGLYKYSKILQRKGLLENYNLHKIANNSK
jgi:acyl-CoA synthetase (NDP forming)